MAESIQALFTHPVMSLSLHTAAQQLKTTVPAFLVGAECFSVEEQVVPVIKIGWSLFIIYTRPPNCWNKYKRKGRGGGINNSLDIEYVATYRSLSFTETSFSPFHPFFFLLFISKVSWTSRLINNRFSKKKLKSNKR